MAKRSKKLKKNKLFVKEQIRKAKAARASSSPAHHKHAEVVLPSRGDHNCPHKNAGSPHRLNLRSCLAKRHVGFCGICGALCSIMHGCPRHHSEGAKGMNLFFEDSEELRAIVKENRERGLFDPNRKLFVTYEKGRVIACDDTERHAVEQPADDGFNRVQAPSAPAEGVEIELERLLRILV